MVGGQAATSISAEIATMKHAEELDALSVMGVDPIKYVAFPVILVLPILMASLTIISVVAMIFCVFAYGALIEGLNLAILNSNLKMLYSIKEFIISVYRCGVIGLSIGFITIYYGIKAEYGATGIGDAAKNTIMWGYVVGLGLVAIFDFLILYKF